VTDESTQRLRPGEPHSTSGLFRVVLDGIGEHGSVATEPTDRATALADFDRLVGVYAADVAAGRLRISVLAEDVWAARTTRLGSTVGR